MDEFLILLQAKLDEAKSKGNVNADIKELQNQLDKLKVQVEPDPKATQKLADSIGKLINQKITISNIGIDTKSGIKAGQEYGKQISQGISQGMSSASKSTEKVLRDFNELNDAKRKFVDGHDLISKDDIADAERLYDTVRKAFSEFGQVTVSKGSMNDGSLENMRVKIEQVNGEMKITRDFMLYFNESRNGFKLVDDDTIRTTEKMIQHLNEEKNIINATNEEANAIKEKLAEQEKYYGKLGQATKEQIALEKQRITAGEKQLEILEEQSKRRDSRISYNEGQIDKKGLSDVSRQRKINDLEYSGREKIDIAFGRELDKSLTNLSKLKKTWQEQGIYVDEFKAKVEILEKSLNEITIGDVKGLNTFKEHISSLSSEAKQLSQIHEITLSMDNGHGASKYQNRIQSLINDFQKYGIAAETAKTQTESLQQILDNMKGMSGQELVTQANKFEQEFKAVKISVDEAKLSYDKLLQPISSTQQINLTNKIEKWLVNNTRATSKARSELQLYLKELESGQVTNGRYTEISNAFTTIDTQMRSMNKLGKSLFQSLSDGAKKFTSWISATAIVMRAITTVRTGIKVVKELDTALVDLKKTANMSARELIGFYHSANDTAKQMGVTTKEIIEQAAAWSRLGFSTADAATKMAKYSSMFATISPGMNLDSATDGLVSVMKAFKIGLENTDEVVDGIMSKINIIGNTQAVNNSDIVDFLRRSSSAMAEANNTLEDTIALGTAMVEITRDAAGAGQVLKTVSMRVRGYDEETEEFIGGVEELSGKIADLTKTASTPGGISLFTDDAKTEFKSTRQLLQEISEIYDQLNDKTQAELLEALAGKRNGQAVSAILNNFDTVTQSLESMSNSAGNAEAEMAIAMDSIDYKLNRVKETGTGIAQNLFGQEDMKLILDAIGSIGNGIDWLTNKLNLFGTIGVGGLGIGITQFVKSFD